MSTGLDASTVTPGSTAPDASVTMPEMLAALVPCARAAGARARHPQMQMKRERVTGPRVRLLVMDSPRKEAAEVHRRIPERVGRRSSAYYIRVPPVQPVFL